ncbi:enoyl-CoA hydratase/isomerase family protein [Bradyrhizobium sp. 31Argb]|uniref:enoyl-CoA hydratase/isomerase family protein n=1 Tax=Bradyrhizobium sp. 31Argb TaxID=3141247 RepID=UPI003749D280
MPVLLERRRHIGLVTLSRPHARNCWGEDFNREFLTVFRAIEQDDEIRCVVITGDEAGGAFSAGADLKNPDTHSTATMADFIKSLPNWRDFPVRVVSDCPKPVIAAVNGYAIGIGCILTYGCDLIVASERAEWRLPQARLGIMPAYGGAVRLARWIGKGNAMKLAMGFPMSGEEAYRFGLAQWLVPHEELMKTAFEVAESIAAQPPLATRLTKESIDRGLDIPNLNDASLVDAYRFMALELTEDKKAAHEAWRERKTPEITGR